MGYRVAREFVDLKKRLGLAAERKMICFMDLSFHEIQTIDHPLSQIIGPRVATR
jgi:hypothetical protein